MGRVGVIAPRVEKGLKNGRRDSFAGDAGSGGTTVYLILGWVVSYWCV